MSPLRVALVNAPLRSLVCDLGVGHQMPLGMLMIGGPLLQDGHSVELIDAAREHLAPREIAARLRVSRPDVVLTGHVGSTSAHPAAIRTLRTIKRALPIVTTVYGGVHPTYHYREILDRHPEVDVVVRGEGEETTRDLIDALATGRDLASVPSIAWRRSGEVVLNTARKPMQDLDALPIGWDLVRDWDAYQAFGLGRAAVVQFSRGCPFTCTFCGQWMFWKRWRHRAVELFLDELEFLHLDRGVRFFWLADENPTTIKEVWREVLQGIVDRGLDIGMCASIRTQDIVRDADILPLYSRAGFAYVLMGVETVTDARMAAIRKGSTVDDAFTAIRLLRDNGILSIVDHIFGLEEETPRTLTRAYRGLEAYDGDFVNALFLTPHSWTPLGRDLSAKPVVERDLAKWDYRHQVLAVPGMSVAALFTGVKLIEAAYHLSPRRVIRLLREPDPRIRQLLRYSFLHTTLVFGAELVEFARSSGHRRRVRRPCLPQPAVCGAVPASAPRPLPGISQIGLTSIDPRFAPGIFAAHLMASSMLGASMM
jgi:anaerobic magnesium-protoporphyrin IX monomethyl ester cyclase